MRGELYIASTGVWGGCGFALLCGWQARHGDWRGAVVLGGLAVLFLVIGWVAWRASDG